MELKAIFGGVGASAIVELNGCKIVHVCVRRFANDPNMVIYEVNPGTTLTYGLKGIKGLQLESVWTPIDGKQFNWLLDTQGLDKSDCTIEIGGDIILGKGSTSFSMVVWEDFVNEKQKHRFYKRRLQFEKYFSLGAMRFESKIHKLPPEYMEFLKNRYKLISDKGYRNDWRNAI